MPTATINKVADHTPSGWVRITCQDPYINLLALLTEFSPRGTAGLVGTWDIIPRPRQVGMTMWRGSEPYQFTLGIMLDGAAYGWPKPARARSEEFRGYHNWESQEPAIRALRAVAKGDASSDGPGVISVTGIPSLPASRWIIEGFEFGDNVIRRTKDMHRVRQDITLTIREYIPPSYKRIAKKALQGTRGKVVVIKVKDGDTPSSIGRRRGVSWKVIAELNPGKVKKAHQDLKTGTKLRVPSKPKHGHGGKK